MDTLDLLSPWQLWLIAATTLLILEIITPGFLLACFGLGALGAMLAAVIGLGVAWQLGVFSLISLLSLFLLRPVLMRRLERHTTPTGVAALIGRRMRLREPIEANAEYTELSIDGDVWRARVEHGTALQAGDQIEIVAIDGIILVVRPC